MVCVCVAEILLCFGKDCCTSANFLVFWKRLLCSRKDCCVLKKIAVFSKRLLCSEKDCCVVQKIVVFFKRLLCFRTEIELCFAPMAHRTAGTRVDKRDNVSTAFPRFAKSFRVFLHLNRNTKITFMFRLYESLFASITFDGVFCHGAILIKVCNFLQVSIFKRYSTPSRKIIQKDK